MKTASDCASAAAAAIACRSSYVEITYLRCRINVYFM